MPNFSHLEKLVGKSNAVVITDEHIFSSHQKRFGGWNTIVISAGESFKVQATVDSIVEQLIEFGADRRTALVGVEWRSRDGYHGLCGGDLYARCFFRVCPDFDTRDGGCVDRRKERDRRWRV
ncbi:hypothetical protein ACQ86N_09205 [Puia sp. P3]|uniref:hypothetical protein n=1 Tax=Puia sp. P3 TaxID=3423952 RepID=UPI003D674CF1